MKLLLLSFCFHFVQPVVVEVGNSEVTITVVQQDGYHELSSMYKSIDKEELCLLWQDDWLSFVGWGLNNGWHEGSSLVRMNTYLPFAPDNCIFIS